MPHFAAHISTYNGINTGEYYPGIVLTAAAAALKVGANTAPRGKRALFIDGRRPLLVINDGSPLPSYFFGTQTAKEPTYNEKQESRELKKRVAMRVKL